MDKRIGCCADEEIKECGNQDLCCISCGYEDCHEGCKEYDKHDGEFCEYAIKTVADEIKTYNIDKLAIYLHSFQAQDYSVMEIKNILASNIGDFKKEANHG